MLVQPKEQSDQTLTELKAGSSKKILLPDNITLLLTVKWHPNLLQ
jgi:hypothetical protein